MKQWFRRRTRKPGEKGFLTIWMLGICICIFFVGGISLDLWRAFSERRQLAAMTDAAAVAAASQIDLDAFKQDSTDIRLDPELARQRAVDYMQTESETNGVTLTDLEVDATPEAVQVRAKTELSTTLMRVLRPGEDLEVEVQSAAQPEAY